MVGKDYILRMIEAIGLIALQIKRMLRSGEVGEAKKALREAQEQAGVDLDMARFMSGETLLAMISPTGQADPSRCMLFGEILYLDGLCELEGGNIDEGRDSLAKAMLLLESSVSYGTAVGVRYPEIDEQLKEIAGLLEFNGTAQDQ